MKPETEKAYRDYYNSYHRKYRKKNAKVKRYQYLRYHYLAELEKVEAGEHGTMLLNVLKKKLDELRRS